MKFKSDEQRRAVMANIGNPSSGSSKKKKKWGISLKGGWKSYAVLDKKPDEKELENLRGEFSNRGYDLGVVSSDKETILTYRPKQALEQPKENPLKVFGAMGTQEEYAESAKNKKWIEAVLSNDEESSDEELIDHFMKEGKISRSQAESWVLLRGDYLRGEMNAKPEPEVKSLTHKFVRTPEMEEPNIRFWFSNDQGDLVTVVKDKTGGSNGSIRVSSSYDSGIVPFEIPTDMVDKLTPEKVVEVATRHLNERRAYKANIDKLKKGKKKPTEKFSWGKVRRGVYQARDPVKHYDYVIEKTPEDAVLSIFNSKIENKDKAFIKSLYADSVSDAKLLAEEWDK